MALMIQWSDRPRNPSPTYGYRLMRVPPNRQMLATIVTGKPIGTNTHYYKGRTTPCAGPTCEACALGLQYRWHAYLAILIAETRETAILELTAQAAEQLDAAAAENGTLRAVEALFDRPSHRPNGRVRIVYRPGRVSEDRLPKEPDLARIMTHIWGMDDQPLTKTTGKHYTHRLVPSTEGNGTQRGAAPAGA
jgi:hypothetical protein